MYLNCILNVYLEWCVACYFSSFTSSRGFSDLCVKFVQRMKYRPLAQCRFECWELGLLSVDRGVSQWSTRLADITKINSCSDYQKDWLSQSFYKSYIAMWALLYPTVKSLQVVIGNWLAQTNVRLTLRCGLYCIPPLKSPSCNWTASTFSKAYIGLWALTFDVSRTYLDCLHM